MWPSLRHQARELDGRRLRRLLPKVVSVAMCSRNAAALEAAATAIRQQYNVEVLSEALDVTNAEAVRTFVEAVVAKFGAADICVTNAGGPPAKGFLPYQS